MSPSRKTTRRQFITGSTADPTELLRQQHADTVEPDSLPLKADPGQTYLLHIARNAMACEFAVFINAGQHERATESAVQALDLVDQLEDQLSIYRPQSEVSRINRAAGEGPIQIDSELFQLLERSIKISEDSQGAFDITAGPLTELWSRVRRSGRIPSEGEITDVLRQVGHHQICMDRELQSIRFASGQMSINLGGIGKGYALDRCIDVLTGQGIKHFLIHGGQSSVAARGDRLHASQSAGWTVGLKHPLRPDIRLAEFKLRDRALGTSGSASKAFRYQGRRIGHILDPRTGVPVEGMLSATVLAPDAATADALSTAFYVMGIERALQFCESHRGLATILVTEGKRAGSIRIESSGLFDDDWQQLAD